VPPVTAYDAGVVAGTRRSSTRRNRVQDLETHERRHGVLQAPGPADPGSRSGRCSGTRDGDGREHVSAVRSRSRRHGDRRRPRPAAGGGAAFMTSIDGRLRGLTRNDVHRARSEGGRGTRGDPETVAGHDGAARTSRPRALRRRAVSFSDNGLAELGDAHGAYLVRAREHILMLTGPVGGAS